MSENQPFTLPVSVELIIETVFTFAESLEFLSVVCANVYREEGGPDTSGARYGSSSRGIH